MNLKLWFFVFFASLVFLQKCHQTAEVFKTSLNTRPIVGVLFQDSRADNFSQIAAASYVKWVEMAGARVVPIFIKRNHSYYSRLFDQINGVLIPGGDAPLLNSGYSDVADLIIETSIAKYGQGIHWPVLATCLGFEKVVTYFTGNQNLTWETRCNVWNVRLNLNFPSGLLTLVVTRLFYGSYHIYKILRQYAVTPNYHHICLSVETFKKNQNLTSNFRLVSTNRFDKFNFVSTIEHLKYPIYATQWHPEKNQFEWIVSPKMGNISHDEYGIQIGQYFGNFFIGEARRNKQQFTNIAEEQSALIYNFNHLLKHPGNISDEEVEEIYVVSI